MLRRNRLVCSPGTEILPMPPQGDRQMALRRPSQWSSPQCTSTWQGLTAQACLSQVRSFPCSGYRGEGGEYAWLDMSLHGISHSQTPDFGCGTCAVLRWTSPGGYVNKGSGDSALHTAVGDYLQCRRFSLTGYKSNNSSLWIS